MELNLPGSGATCVIKRSVSALAKQNLPLDQSVVESPKAQSWGPPPDGMKSTSASGETLLQLIY